MDETQQSNDQAERIRRLQERRAASGRSKPAAQSEAVGASAGPTSRSSVRPAARRKHPAAASRILLAGLSVASFFSVGGAIALANRIPAAQSVAATATTSATTPGNGATASATGAQPLTATNAVAHTVTKGS